MASRQVYRDLGEADLGPEKCKVRNFHSEACQGHNLAGSHDVGILEVHEGVVDPLLGPRMRTAAQDEAQSELMADNAWNNYRASTCDTCLLLPNAYAGRRA